CHALATFWNALQHPDEQWFGVIGYPGSYRVYMLILFPDNRPYSTFQLLMAKRGDPNPGAYTGKKIVYEAPDHRWLYWEIPSPEAASVSHLTWQWSLADHGPMATYH